MCQATLILSGPGDVNPPVVPSGWKQLMPKVSIYLGWIRTFSMFFIGHDSAGLGSATMHPLTHYPEHTTSFSDTRRVFRWRSMVTRNEEGGERASAGLTHRALLIY